MLFGIHSYSLAVMLTPRIFNFVHLMFKNFHAGEEDENESEVSLIDFSDLVHSLAEEMAQADLGGVKPEDDETWAAAVAAAVPRAKEHYEAHMQVSNDAL